MGLSNYPPGVSGNEPEIQGWPDEEVDPELEYDWIREQTSATLVRKYGDLCYKRGHEGLNDAESDALDDIQVELHVRGLLDPA